MLFVLFIAFAAFDGLLAEKSSKFSQLEFIEGAFWTMDGSHVLDENNSNGFEERNVSESFDISYVSKRDCYFREERQKFEDCQYQVADTYDANRVPQVMPTVRCIQRKDGFSRRIRFYQRTKCEEVRIQVPVLKKNGVNYKYAFETLSVACVRTALPSKIKTKTGYTVSFDSI